MWLFDEEETRVIKKDLSDLRNSVKFTTPPTSTQSKQEIVHGEQLRTDSSEN